MIPVELKLRNFLSYGDEETTLDFRPLHVTCLSGENGHGKSALLDAITWSLWGETRLGKQGHEQLIRIGADEMAVQFTFGVGGDLYRVRRQRGKRSGGQIWELQQDDGNGGWRPLTGTTASDTGRIIQQLLRMSYDTFLNSAYLKQGRADEFVRQTSNKRKEILCDILELARYDRLEDKAKQRARDAGESTLEAERRLNQIEKILIEEQGHRQDLESVENRVAELTAEAERLGSERHKMGEFRATLQHQRDRALRIHEEIADLAAQLAELEAERGESRRGIERANALLADRKQIEQDYQSLVTARERAEDLRERVAELHIVEKQRYVLHTEMRDTEKTLTSDLQAKQKEIADIQRRTAQALPYRQKLVDLRSEIVTFDRLEQHRQELQERLGEETTQKALLKRDNEQCEAQIAEIKARLQRLNDESEVCSVCGSPLPPEKVAVLKVECEEELAQVKARQNQLKQAGQQRNLAIQSLQADLKESDNARGDAQRIREQIARFEQQFRDLDEMIDRLPELTADEKTLAHQLDNRDYAHDLRAEITQIDARFQELSPSAAEQENNYRLLKQLARADDLHQALQQAQAALERESKVLASVEKSAARACQTQEALLKEQQALAEVESQYRRVEADLRDLQARQQTTTRQASELEQERGKLRQQLKTYADLRVEQTARQSERDLARKEENAYKQLAGAFGKRGVQADIIENALPELQNYANEILDRLTDGDMSIHIDTQRQSRTRNAALIETLDIQISDSLGTRPLEMYSGGEAFRVSFALRIALSKLLARRAGADLQTLIVDEGFGTQDAKGREKLVDAVTAIQPDFEKILVITHIDELKDAFASRIEVVKTPMGSQLTVTYGDSVG